MIAAELDGSQSRQGTGLWAIFADRRGIGETLKRALTRRGHHCAIIEAGDAFSGFSRGRASVDPERPEDFAAAIKALAEQDRSLMGIVYLWPCDHAYRSDPLTNDLVGEIQRKATYPALYLVQGAIAAQKATAVYIVSAGGKRFGEEADRAAPASLALAPLIGFTRTAYAENPPLAMTSIDLDPCEQNERQQAKEVLAEILAVEGRRETEVGYRRGKRHVARFAARGHDSLRPRQVPAAGPKGRTGFALTMDQPGDLDDLMLSEIVEEPPEPDEVCIAVGSVGLNFRDVMAATALLPLDAEKEPAWFNLGLECAGVVHSVGDKVADFRPGDAVAATHVGCLRSRINVKHQAVRKTPDGMSSIDAATLLSAFSTAYYALVTKARLRKGERVLIHFATGGVGLAAIQIAQMVGAEILATAGTLEKRDYLRSLGITQVMDSRSLQFAEDVREITKGDGVDVLLNAISGEAIFRGIDILAPGGRFLEIGKRDIYADSGLSMKQLKRNISFFAIDMARMQDDDPETLTEVLTEIGRLIKDGTLKPLRTEVFPIERARDAFAQMAKGGHMGKVVVTIDPDNVDVALSEEQPAPLVSDGSYLITGGLSGYGLEIAVWMAERGAGQIILLSRSGAATEAAREGVRRIEDAGAKTLVLIGDVSKADELASCFAEIVKLDKPLRGIIHSAVVYDDAAIPQLNAGRMDSVFGPKVDGSLNLHRESLAYDLDFFIMSSSTSVPLGHVGQANYVAANIFMHSLARWRCEQGLPGMCVDWGVMDTGEVARSPELKKIFVDYGFPPMPVETALEGFDVLLRKSDPVVAYTAIDWQKYAHSNAHSYAQPRLVGRAANSRSSGDRRAYHETMAAPIGTRPLIVARYLTDEIAKVLKTDPEKVGADTALEELGLDSLSAFQLKNRVEAEFGLNLQVAGFLQNPTSRKIAALIVKGLERGDQQTGTGGTQAGSSVQQLSMRQAEILGSLHQHRDNKTYRRSFESSGAMSISPRVDVDRLREVMIRLAEEHPILGNCFPRRRGLFTIARSKLAQMVREDDCTRLSETEFQERLAQSVLTPMDLAKGPLFETVVFHRPDNTDVLMTRSHNGLVDGLSYLYVTELCVSAQFGADSELIEVVRGSIDFADFADWQRKFIASPKGKTQLRYWRQKLRDLGPPLALPYDHERRSPVPLSGGNHSLRFDATVREKLQRLAKEQDSSLYALFLTIFAQVLEPYAQGNDVFITTSAMARTRRELQGTFGPVSNTVLIKALNAPGRTTLERLVQIDADLLEALSNQDYPATALKRDLDLKPAPETALEQVAFAQYLPERSEMQGTTGILAGIEGTEFRVGPVTMKNVALPNLSARRDLTVLLQDHQGDVTLRFNYDAALFERKTIEKLGEKFEDIARSLIKRGNSRRTTKREFEALAG